MGQVWQVENRWRQHEAPVHFMQKKTCALRLSVKPRLSNGTSPAISGAEIFPYVESRIFQSLDDVPAVVANMIGLKEDPFTVFR